MKTIFQTLGRILIIFALAALIVAGLSLLTSSGAGAATTGQLAFDGNLPTRLEGFHPDGHAGGADALGLLELVKNIAVMGMIIATYWFGQKWFEQAKRKRLMTA